MTGAKVIKEAERLVQAEFDRTDRCLKQWGVVLPPSRDFLVVGVEVVPESQRWDSMVIGLVHAVRGNDERKALSQTRSSGK